MAVEVDARIEEKISIMSPLSWRAIIAGVVVALVVQLLLGILGSAVGLAFINPAEAGGADPGITGIIVAIWWVLSGILAAWAGGLTAGRLSGMPGTRTAGWHGLVAWAATTLVIFYLLASAVGGIIGGAFSVLGGAASATGHAVPAAAPPAAAAAPQLANASSDPFSGIEASVNDALGTEDPAAARTAVTSFVRSAMTATPEGATAATDRAVDALSRAGGITADQARERLTAWKTEYDRTVASVEQQAAEAADAARKAASAAGILAVIALIFGALAGWYGGRESGVREDDGMVTRIAGRLPGVTR